MAIAQRYVPASDVSDEDGISRVFKVFYDGNGPRQHLRQEWDSMPSDQKRIVRQSMELLHDRMIGNMRAMPSQLMLVFRLYIII